MNERITKKDKEKIKEIVSNFGYWSNEFQNYVNQFEHYKATQLCNFGLTWEKYGYMV